MSKLYEKCDKCKNWPLGCELDGGFRRYCIKNNYIHFKPKEGANRGEKV